MASLFAGKASVDNGVVISEETLPAGIPDVEEETPGNAEDITDSAVDPLQPPKLSKEDLELENAALKAILLQYQSRLVGSSVFAKEDEDEDLGSSIVLVPSAPAKETGEPGEESTEVFTQSDEDATTPSAPPAETASGATHLDCQLEKTIKDMKRNLSTPEGTKAFFQDLKSRVTQPEFLTMLDEHTQSVMVHAKDTDHEVAIVDLDNAEWWTIVPGGDPIQPEVKHVDTTSLGGSYVLVEDTDVTDAIAEHVALYLRAIPASSKLTNKELQTLMAGAFSELAEKGPVGKLWDWGKFIYATYGWGAMTFNIYRDPTLVRAVLRVLWSLCKYTMIMMIG